MINLPLARTSITLITLIILISPSPPRPLARSPPRPSVRPADVALVVELAQGAAGAVDAPEHLRPGRAAQGLAAAPVADRAGGEVHFQDVALFDCRGDARHLQRRQAVIDAAAQE